MQSKWILSKRHIQIYHTEVKPKLAQANQKHEDINDDQYWHLLVLPFSVINQQKSNKQNLEIWREIIEQKFQIETRLDKKIQYWS